MDVLSSEWRDRIAHWIRTLKQDFYSPLGEIGWEAFRTRDHLSSRELESCEFVPVNPGFTWGETWEYCWFRGRVTLPEAAQGKRIVLNLSPGGESTLFVNGRSFGTYRADWVSEPHHYLVDNALTAQGRAGDCYEVLMETYAGHYYPDMGLCATGPVLPGAYQDPLPEGARRTLGQCTYGVWNEDAYQLYMDVDTLSKLLDVLDSGLPLREKGYTLKADYSKASAANALDGGHFPAPMAIEPVNITADGKAQCLRATYYKDGIRNMVGNTIDRKTCVAGQIRMNRLGGLYGQCTRWGIFDPDGKAPCLTASAGMGGGHVSMCPIRVGAIECRTGTESQSRRVYSPEGKSTALCAGEGGAGARTGLYAVPSPLDYAPPPGTVVRITGHNIRCARQDDGGTMQGYDLRPVRL